MLTGAAVPLVAPALLLRPLSVNATFWLAFPVSIVVAVILMLVRGNSTTRSASDDRGHRYLTGRTRSGERTVDLSSLKSVRALHRPGAALERQRARDGACGASHPVRGARARGRAARAASLGGEACLERRRRFRVGRSMGRVPRD
jgi:hypothetical protein